MSTSGEARAERAEPGLTALAPVVDSVSAVVLSICRISEKDRAKAAKCESVVPVKPVRRAHRGNPRPECVCLLCGWKKRKRASPSVGAVVSLSLEGATLPGVFAPWSSQSHGSVNLVDPASSHMLRSRAKPCMSQSKWFRQWVCEWLLTSAVISVIVCGRRLVPSAPSGTSSKTLWLIHVRSGRPQHMFASDLLPVLAVDCAQLIERPAPQPRAVCMWLIQAGPPGTGRAGRVVAPATAIA